MAGRELLGSGLFFHDARYNAVGAVPWHDLRESISRVTIDESLAFFERGNMNYWFYGMGKIESVSGLDNLRGIGEMLHTFGACSNLKTILADTGWALPTSGITASRRSTSAPRSLEALARLTRARGRATST